ncbi:MAG TPA: hypothetical protein PK586_01625 [Casimicrobium sp.]|nr:hypothetical protein [Casimicrobium sp.]
MNARCKVRESKRNVQFSGVLLGGLLCLAAAVGAFSASAQVTPIRDVQGSGLTSPVVGQSVIVRGVVTAVRSNGFFIQEPDASVDADPATSEGIFVFTSSAAPAAAAVGNLVQVTGTVLEFTPIGDPSALSVTQISSPIVTLLSTGNPLPAPIVLTTAQLNAAGGIAQLERFEGMRVSIPSLTVVSPSEANIAESSAAATSTGIYYGVITGTMRPLREPGRHVLDAIAPPFGVTPPQFDGNPEVIQVRSRGQVGATSADVTTGSTVTNLVGVLDYIPRRYALLPDVGSGSISGGATLRAVTPRATEEATIASLSLSRFYDEINDSNGGPTLTAAALDKRLTKAAAAIGDFARTPDIIAVQDVENLRVLGLLADRINSTVAPAPQYVPYLVQGNDTSGLNIGFLVSTRTVGASLPRVEVLEVTQFLKDTLLTNADTSTSLLFAFPPLRLRAVIHFSATQNWPVTVFNAQLRTTSGQDDPIAGSNGWATEGDRVRAFRQAQATQLATLIQSRQAANANENIVVTGDFKSFEFNDGYVHPMGVVAGVPAPDTTTFVPGDGVSPVTPALTNVAALVASAERYNVSEQGNAQLFAHVLASNAATASTAARRVEFARVNVDFAASNYGTAGTATRFAAQDPAVAYFLPKALATLNVDGSGATTRYHALTDGLTILRYLRGETGVALSSTLASGAIRTDGNDIKQYLDAMGLRLDIDGNGVKDAATDGLLILRHLLGFRGAALINDAIATSPPATRTTATDIANHLATLAP